MAFELKPNTGSLMRNMKKELETHPNATGKALIDGREYWISAWTKTSQSGAKWQSLSFKPVEKNPAGRTAPAGSIQDMEDDIPF